MKIQLHYKTVILIMIFSCFSSTMARHESSTSNFSVMDFVKDNFYIDKTMLIRDFIRMEQPMGIIRAPSKFGKSTAINMLNKFLSIPVDSNGTRLTPNVTDNIFCSNSRKICKNMTFVKQHMGQYPVMHISYQPLRQVNNSSTLVEKLKIVVVNTFRQHLYLRHNQTLLSSNKSKEDFYKFCDAKDQNSWDDWNIVDAFAWLLHRLFEHFGRKIIILLDDYDVFWSDVMFSEITDKDEVLRILERINVVLFVYNDLLERALLTGILEVKDDVWSITTTFIKDFRWLGDHTFSKYVGLTEKEVVQLIAKNVRDDRKRMETKRIIDDFYAGYRVLPSGTKIYSTWSILSFFKNKLKVECYWKPTTFYKWMKKLITNDKVLIETIKLLAQTRCCFGADLAEPLSGKAIRKINLTPPIHMFYSFIVQLLFHFGYLTEMEGNPKELFVPSREIHNQLCELLQ